MSLLWRTAAAQPYEWSHETSPRESEEDVDLDEVEPRLGHSDLNYHHRKALEDSIRQHGYSPERHGKLGWNFHNGGDNVYMHAPGTETDPMHTEHAEHLLRALKATGHTTVPMHIHDQSSDIHGNAPALYHGTNVPDLDGGVIHPNHGSRGTFGFGTHEPGYAYATGRHSAESYADTAAMEGGGRPRVYRVYPLGPVEKDPTYDAAGRHRGNHSDDVRSKHGFLVDSEEDLGHPEEDDDEDYWGEDHEHGDW